MSVKNSKYYEGIDDIELPSKKNSSKKKRRKNKKSRKIIAIIIIEVIVLLILLGVLFVKRKLDKIEKYDLDKENLKITDLGVDGYINIIVFGVDARDGELDKNTRSDTMMLVSIDTENKKINLTSFYRDTYSYIEGHDYTKLGHAYSYGGPELAISTINDNYDLDITNFVTVNFTSVADAINLLGGVEIDVLPKEVDSLNKYGREVAKISGANFTPITSSGLQTLDGYQAVGYSRIRKIDSDFMRTSRQRAVVNAMFSKIKTSDLSTINSMYDELSKEILTSMSNKEILTLIKDVVTYDINESDGFPYQTQIASIKKASCVLPSDLYTDVKELHRKIFGIDDWTPTEDVITYSNYIKSLLP